MRLPKLPWVSRALYETALVSRDAAFRAAKKAEDDAARAIQRERSATDAANARAHEAFAASLKAINESRGALREAAEMAKTASAALFGPAMHDEGAVSGTSVGQADRQAAAKMRERDEEEQARRRR